MPIILAVTGSRNSTLVISYNVVPLCSQSEVIQSLLTDHGWMRDNVYAAHALWALYRAFQKSADYDEDMVKANELGLTWLVF